MLKDNVNSRYLCDCMILNNKLLFVIKNRLDHKYHYDGMTINYTQPTSLKKLFVNLVHNVHSNFSCRSLELGAQSQGMSYRKDTGFHI